jgi:4-hydroxybenzoate polyprenyltransferase
VTGNPAGPAPADAAKDNIVDRYAPVPWQPYLRMARIDRPVGWQLLLLPCWWSAALAAAASNNHPRFDHFLLFLIGAIAMRGAGCVWNDIVDRELDARVERTRNRPLPSGQIKVRQAAAFAIGLCLVGLIVLLSLNSFSIALGFLSLAPVAVYPFMKRITNYPQAVLGLTFSWGALMGWAAFTGGITAAPVFLYIATNLWVIGYDTMYAIQDIDDDGIVGIRSTARHFGPKVPQLVAGCYAGSVVLTATALALAGVGLFSWLGLAAFAAHLAWQGQRLHGADGATAHQLFKSNWHAGLLLALGLFIDCFV